MYNSLNILFFILWITDPTSTQICYERKSRIKHGAELVCNGLFQLLRLETVPQSINELTLSKNEITTIDLLSFNKDLSSVEYLSLDNNNITIIAANTFKNLPNLNEIDLSYNMLEILDLEAFTLNKHLKTIDLTGNRLRILDVNLVNTLHDLKKFILSKNMLNFCHSRTVETLNYLDQKQIETHFVERCEKQEFTTEVETGTTVKGDKDMDAYTTGSNATIESHVLLFLVLAVILLFTVGLGTAITVFCLKISKKFDSKFKGRKRTTTETALMPGESPRFSRNSDEDENGYMVPTVPVYQAKYLEVLGDGCQPLINLGSEENLNQPTPSVSTCVEIPAPHVPPRTANYESDTNRPINVYEEIKDRSFYTRNLQDHLLQPYRCVRKVSKNLETC